MATVHQEEIIVGSQDNDQLYQIWCSVLTQPPIQQLDSDAARLFDTIAQIGYQHADSKSAYKNDISRCFSQWSEKVHSLRKALSNDSTYNALLNDTADTIKYDPSEVLYISHVVDTYNLSSRKKTTVFSQKSCYIKDEVSDSQAKSLERQFSEYMKRVIPLSYAIAFAVSLSFSFVFGFTFYMGLTGGNYFIGPWTNLMLLIAATGLTITVFAACSEWRSWQRGFQEKDKQNGRKKHRK